VAAPSEPEIVLRWEVPAEQAELCALALWDHGATAVEVRDEEEGSTLLLASLPTCAATRSVAASLGADVETVAADWADGWKPYAAPVPVGSSLVVVPSWRDVSVAGGRMTVRIDPGRCFGSGSHPSTRLLLALLAGEAVEAVATGTAPAGAEPPDSGPGHPGGTAPPGAGETEPWQQAGPGHPGGTAPPGAGETEPWQQAGPGHPGGTARQRPAGEGPEEAGPAQGGPVDHGRSEDEAPGLGGLRVADVGTGSGILAVAAALLGATRVLAVDIDPEAVAVARANALANGVGATVEVTCSPLGLLDGPVDLALVNVTARTHAELGPEVAALVRPGGRIYLAGLLPGQWRHVAGGYSPCRPDRLVHLDGWEGAVLTRPGAR